MTDDVVQTEQPAPSAGQMIREAREAAGIHLGVLSMALKVPVRKLEALEADDWTQLPDAVFVRALATSVCRQIKTDSAPILAVLPQTPKHRVLDDTEARALNQPFRSPTDARLSWLQMPKAMPMMVGTFVLLLAAIVLIFLPDVVKQVETLPLQTSVPTTPIVTPPEVPVLPAAPLPPVLVPPAITASAPVVVAPTPLVAASKPAALPAAVNVNSILRIEAKGVVWVEVKDSKGAVLIQRTLQPKEVANVSGQPPLAVVVGRINEIASVMVRGKPLSMDGMSPDNVARFEVK